MDEKPVRSRRSRLNHANISRSCNLTRHETSQCGGPCNDHTEGETVKLQDPQIVEYLQSADISPFGGTSANDNNIKPFKQVKCNSSEIPLHTLPIIISANEMKKNMHSMDGWIKDCSSDDYGYYDADPDVTCCEDKLKCPSTFLIDNMLDRDSDKNYVASSFSEPHLEESCTTGTFDSGECDIPMATARRFKETVYNEKELTTLCDVGERFLYLHTNSAEDSSSVSSLESAPFYNPTQVTFESPGTICAKSATNYFHLGSKLRVAYVCLLSFLLLVTLFAALNDTVYWSQQTSDYASDSQLHSTLYGVSHGREVAFPPNPHLDHERGMRSNSNVFEGATNLKVRDARLNKERAVPWAKIPKVAEGVVSPESIPNPDISGFLRSNLRGSKIDHRHKKKRKPIMSHAKTLDSPKPSQQDQAIVHNTFVLHQKEVEVQRYASVKKKTSYFQLRGYTLEEVSLFLALVSAGLILRFNGLLYITFFQLTVMRCLSLIRRRSVVCKKRTDDAELRRSR